ncbi:MAG: glutathione s-transferase [Rhodobiaceae bacterium]|nr:MAG: glutathione s-transferase [Rhodobiaceae bacterium]
MSGVTLTTTALSAYGRIARVILAEKGVSCELDFIEFSDLPDKSYAQKHPFHKVPVLFHNDLHLYETAAIGRYIDEAFEGPALQPTSPVERAHMEKWISIANQYLYPRMIGDLVWQRLVVPLQGGEANEEQVAGSLDEIKSQVALMEAELSDGREYITGTFSLADAFLGPILFFTAMTPEGQEIVTSNDKVAAWLDRVTKRDSWEATQ